MTLVKLVMVVLAAASLGLLATLSWSAGALDLAAASVLLLLCLGAYVHAWVSDARQRRRRDVLSSPPFTTTDK